MHDDKTILKLKRCVSQRLLTLDNEKKKRATNN